MRRAIRHIIRGCRNLPHCGEHPGTLWLFFFPMMGAFAGIQTGSILGVVTGAGAMLAFAGPIYLFGAYGRSVDDERYERAAQRCPKCGGRLDSGTDCINPDCPDCFAEGRNEGPQG